MKKIRILLADDHAVVRQGMHLLLDQQKDMTVVGEVSDGLQLLEQADKLRPDVVLVDLKMPNLNGLDAAEELHRRFPFIHSVILTMHADRAYIDRAVAAGVCGYVLKEEEIGEICVAIRYAALGAHYLSEGVTRRLPVMVNEKTASNPIMLLTRRERQVFQLIAESKTNAEAAHLLHISVRTVEVHRAHIMEKLNLKTHVDFVRFALKFGIFEDGKE